MATVSLNFISKKVLFALISLQTAGLQLYTDVVGFEFGKRNNRRQTDPDCIPVWGQTPTAHPAGINGQYPTTTMAYPGETSNSGNGSGKR